MPVEEASFQINVPVSKVGIARIEMPQIESKLVPDFLKYLKTNGVRSRKTKKNVSSLSVTQADISKDKVKAMMKAPEKVLSKPIIISKDGFILDGHHRFVALLNRNPKFRIDVIEVNTDIMELLRLAKEYGNTFYKGIHEKFLYKWDNIGSDDLERIVKENRITLRKNRNDTDKLNGVLEGTIIFSWDSFTREIQSDYTKDELRVGIV